MFDSIYDKEDKTSKNELLERGTGNLAAVKKLAQQSITDAKLHVLRLRCFDLDRSVEFYKVLNMALITFYESPNNIMFAYLGCTNNTKVRQIQLLLEHNPQDAGQIPIMPPSPSSLQHLVFYVNDLTKYVDNMIASGFVPVIKPFKVNKEMHMAVFMDPNFFCVRLIEMTRRCLLESPDRDDYLDWNARLAYVTIQVEDMDAVIAFYEEIFSQRRIANIRELLLVQRDVKEKKEKEKEMNKNRPRTRRRTPDDKSFEEPKETELTFEDGVYCIDEVTFPQFRTTYKWVGNGPRDAFFSICFIEVEGQSPLEQCSEILGWGFEVLDVHESTAKLEKRVLFTDKHLEIPDIGFYSRFLDHCTGLEVDVIGSKDSYFSQTDGAVASNSTDQNLEDRLVALAINTRNRLMQRTERVVKDRSKIRDRRNLKEAQRRNSIFNIDLKDSTVVPEVKLETNKDPKILE